MKKKMIVIGTIETKQQTELDNRRQEMCSV
jgi:hypothetical protein